MKKYWHTKTLFLQNWKYYKWSYKYNHCIVCGTCNHKHKWKWLCTSCFDKQRYNDPKRIITRKKISNNYYLKSKTDIIKKEKIYNNIKKYQEKNKEILRLLRLVRYKKNRWYKIMEYNINWKIKYLPFETLEKPKTHNDKNYNKWQQDIKDFELLKKYYDNLKI
jgi:hypothetical protein